MEYIRKANDRGAADFGWLQSRHTFSFGSYYDAKHMGLSELRVINDDYVAPGAGFDTHSHKNMEIISYITSGAIAHKDSMGNEFVVPAGEVQRMTAGTGLTHSEYNASETEPLTFLQIWVKPKITGLKPGYQQAHIGQTSALTPLVTPTGSDGSLKVHQDASMYRLRLNTGEAYELNRQQPNAYFQIVRGAAEVNGKQFSGGDGIGLTNTAQLQVTATSSDFEALWFELP